MRKGSYSKRNNLCIIKKDTFALRGSVFLQIDVSCTKVIYIKTILNPTKL